LTRPAQSRAGPTRAFEGALRDLAHVRRPRARAPRQLDRHRPFRLVHGRGFPLYCRHASFVYIVPQRRKSPPKRSIEELHATAAEIRRRSDELLKQMKELAREIEARRAQPEPPRKKPN
jgi:hypothetical protein